MLVGLSLAGYVFVLLILQMKGAGWRTAAMGAATVWGVLVVLITELLSLAQGLTTAGLATTWLVVDMAALIYLWQGSRRRSQQSPLQLSGVPARPMISRLPRMQMFLLLGVGAIITLAAIVAVLSPPNTWDAMAYHIPRVVNWMQHRSIAFYPTSDHRQLHMPPWAEFAMLHMHLLSGADGLDNLIQWASLLGSVVGVTLLAKLMGADYRGQILAAVLCATIPQGLLEASGAKNDYVMAFWMVILAYYLLAFKREPTWANTLGIGGALGLAWLTKGTAYIFALAIGFTCITAWPWKPRLSLSRRLPFIVVFALALNAGIFVRNYTLYGSPFGPTHYGDRSLTLRNDGITPSTLVSNALRNLALHLGTPVAAINTALERGIVAAIRAIGEDPNNPHTTWGGMAFQVPEPSRHEALAGNPLHVMLILLTIVLMLGWRQLRRATDMVVYTAGLVLAFALFCALLRWQPWHTRLHLPLFVLWAAPVSMVLGQVRSKAVVYGVSLLLLLQALPFVLENQLRPLVFGGMFNVLSQERSTLYFADRRELLDSYRAVTDLIQRQGCQHVGLDAPMDGFEYPLLALLDIHRGKRSVTHVGVQNPSARYGQVDGGVQPCAVVCLGCVTTIEKWKAYATEVGPGMIVDDILVFRAPDKFLAANAEPWRPTQCTLTFADGWHALEQNGNVWWRWSRGRAEIHMATATDSHVVLVGRLSAVELPNAVDLLVDDAKVVTWAITGHSAQPFTPVRLHLEAGQHRLVFAGHKPAIHLHSDPRPLAFAAMNLFIVSADGTTVCELQP